MASNTVSVTTCESGDWQILQYEDYEASGHSLSTNDWISLVRYLGYEVEEEEISDEDMEERC